MNRDTVHPMLGTHHSPNSFNGPMTGSLRLLFSMISKTGKGTARIKLTGAIRNFLMNRGNVTTWLLVTRSRPHKITLMIYRRRIPKSLRVPFRRVPGKRTR